MKRILLVIPVIFCIASALFIPSGLQLLILPLYLLYARYIAPLYFKGIDSTQVNTGRPRMFLYSTIPILLFMQVGVALYKLSFKLLFQLHVGWVLVIVLISIAVFFAIFCKYRVYVAALCEHGWKKDRSFSLQVEKWSYHFHEGRYWA